MLVCVMRDRIAANLTWSLILGAPASPRNGDNTKAYTAEQTQFQVSMDWLRYGRYKHQIRIYLIHRETRRRKGYLTTYELALPRR